MVETARRVVEDGRSHAGLELVFTLKEEVGLKAQTPSTAAGSQPAWATSTTWRGRSGR